MHFITPRILVMPFPTEELIPSLATYLNSAYSRQYIIFNLSEYTYDPHPFHSQVHDHSFSGFPNPPLEALFSICTSIKTWLDTDLGNVAVLHCQGKQVRSLMVLALFLVWTSTEFSDVLKAVSRLGILLRCGEVQLQPSQLRYVQYSESVLHGVKVTDRQPLEVTLRLDRLIFTGIPISGARPYLQVFEGRELVFSSASQ
jgi:tensin